VFAFPLDSTATVRALLLFVTFPQSIRECLEDLTMAKDVWDTAVLCELQFGAWRDTLWADIRTDLMEEGAKAFIKEVKGLHKKVRDVVAA
jgi:hypothetical protein